MSQAKPMRHSILRASRTPSRQTAAAGIPLPPVAYGRGRRPAHIPAPGRSSGQHRCGLRSRSLAAGGVVPEAALQEHVLDADHLKLAGPPKRLPMWALYNDVSPGGDPCRNVACGAQSPPQFRCPVLKKSTGRALTYSGPSPIVSSPFWSRIPHIRNRFLESKR